MSTEKETTGAANSDDYQVRGCRKARVGKNACADCDDGKTWACFMHTLYLGRWYYDGYTAHATQEEAIACHDAWLAGRDS